MHRTLSVLMAALLVLLSGCPHNHYRVTMTPRGDAVERTLVFYRSDDSNRNARGPDFVVPYDADETASIAAFYPEQDLKNDGDRHTVTGEFPGALPGDVGGNGWYRNLSTSLGTAGFYMERFRGNDDIAGMMMERFRAADQFADLVIGWSRELFVSEPGYPQLYRFLDQEFRRDLKNYSFYSWMDEGSYMSDSTPESGARLIQYFIERRYVEVQEIPGIVQAWELEQEKVFCRLLQRFFARKLAIPEGQELPPPLALLADIEAVEESWATYLTGTEFYRARLQEKESAGATENGRQEPDPNGVMLDLLGALTESGNTGSGDHLTVALSLPTEPIVTNGKWVESEKHVAWETELPAKKEISRLPALCYAGWAAPEEDFQREHLGGVSLKGEELFEYSIWRAGLEDKKGAEWEEFLAGLGPGENMIDELDTFRFSGELEKPDGGRLESDRGKELIKGALSSLKR